MTDYTKLKRLAEDAGSVEWRWWDSNSTLRLTTETGGRHGVDGDAISAYRDSVQCPESFRAFIEAASPAAVQALIAENEQLKIDNGSLRGSTKRMGEDASKEQKQARKAQRETDQLKAELAGLRTGFDAQNEVIAELKKDAERYRWLRDKQTFIWLIQDWFPGAEFTDVDAEIDAAMSKGEQA